MAYSIDSYNALLCRLIDDLGGPVVPDGGAGPVYNGEPSLAKNVGEVLPYALAADAALADWDPGIDIPDAVIWRADEGVTLAQDDATVTSWAAWRSPAGATAAAVGTPTLEGSVFGIGARHFPGVPPGEPWLMRSGDAVTQALLMGMDGSTPHRHTIIFWVKPDTVTPDDDMTICCVWTPGETCEDEPNPHRCAYWLGLTTEGKFVYKATSNGCPASAVEVESTVSVAPGVWYRVVAQFAAGTQGNELRLGVGAGSSGLTWVTVGFAGAGIFGVASGETGIPFHVGGWTADYVWRGSMSHGYYYKAALGTTAIDALAGAGKQPINYVDMAEAEDVDTANVESVWQLDEPSTQYAYDQLGSNNLHWGYWHVGSAPGPTGGFPGIRLVRTFYQGKPTNCQYFTCNALASQFSGVNKPMSVFILMRIVNSEATSDPNGFIGLGNTGSNMPYRMWHNTAAYHRDSSNAYAQVQLYQGEGDWAEDTNPSGPTTYTKWAYDAAAHVLCCTWGGSPYSVNFYPDGPLGADTGTMAGVGSVTFNEFSIGAIARATDDVIFPMDGYIGMVVLVPRVISSVERWSLMEWMKRTAGVY